MGDVRLRQLRLRHGGHHRDFQCVLRQRIAGAPTGPTLLWTTVVAISSRDCDDRSGRCLRLWADRRATSKQVLALATVGCGIDIRWRWRRWRWGRRVADAACVLFIASNRLLFARRNFTAAFCRTGRPASTSRGCPREAGALVILADSSRSGVCLVVLSQQAAGAKSHRLHPVDAGDYGRHLCAGRCSDLSCSFASVPVPRASRLPRT